MKVLHIGKYFPPRYGGIETFMSHLMEEQAKQGVAVSAIIHADNPQSDTGDYIWKGCRIFEVKSYGQVVFAPFAPGYPFKLIKALRAIKPDILHIHMPNLSAFWLLVLKRLFARQAKMVIHWHADVLGSAPTKLVKLFYPVYKLFETRLLKNADKVIATSPPYLETSIPLKPFRNKCVVIPLGIKIKNFDVSSKKFSEAHTLSLCMIGRLAYYKGHSVVLKALQKLQAENVQVTLDVIGDGELASSLKYYCTEIGLGDIVSWHGSVSEELKDEILKSSDILLLPSLERTEAFGVVLLEAANFGVPSLISDVPGSGMSFIVQDGDTGLICNENTSEYIAQVLSLASTEKLKLAELGQASFKRLVYFFNIKGITTLVCKEY